MNESIDHQGLLEAYKQHDFELRTKLLKIAIALSLIAIPSGVTLDYMIYPGWFLELISYRSVAILVIIALLAALFTPLVKNIKTLGVLLPLTINTATCLQIMATEGATSPYYAGICTVLFAVGILMPWTVIETLITCVITMVIYIAATLLHFHFTNVDTYDMPTLYNNAFFLILTSVICITGSYYQTKKRFTEYRLNYELNLQYKKLEELDHLKSEFFANISHELRTPLTLILAPIQDLSENTSIPADARLTLATVKNNALRLLKLVNDLLEIVRLEEGKFTLQKNPIKLNELFNGLVESVSHLARKKEIEIIKEMPDNPMIVMGDTRALEKVFLNILINAIKFSDANGRISINGSINETDHQAVIEIIDTGIGISDSELPFIFDRFRQADGSTTRKQQGTGLGLALAKELTEKHEGQISASSAPGAGTSITITLPLMEPDLQQSQESSEGQRRVHDPLENIHREAELSAAVTVQRSNTIIDAVDEAEPLKGSLEKRESEEPTRPTLLVVDDEPEMQRYLINILKDDYQVISADNGSKGLKLARKVTPDLILLDYMMPGIDGLEVCKTIKEDEQLEHCKVMMLTARIDETAKISALELGADDFLTKPFSSVEVKTRLKNLFHTTELQRKLGKRNEELKTTLNQLQQTQSQLLQSEKLNALGKLSAGLLHEINNPLNYTLTALQLAQMDPAVQADEELKEICQDIDDGMQRIRTIVSDLRAFAYPTEAEIKSNFKFMDAIESALRFTAQEHKGITIEQESCRNCVVMGSQSHITQVLVNLLANAAKAVQKADRGDDGRIEIACHSQEGRLHIDVKDNGTGISEETLPYIFDPFYTTRDVGEGMGLGLSICHTIIKNHEGNLSAESELGAWTVFRFDLPQPEN